MRTNCWFYAIPRWWRGEKRYLILRWSVYHRWIPHAMLTNDISPIWIEEVVPVNPKEGFMALLSAPLFEARFREGFGEEKERAQ